MSNWLLRGLVLAGVMVVLRLIQGVLINTWESQSGLVGVLLLIVFVIAPTVWGLYDGRDDATANPDPDRRRDLAMTWLIAGLAAGVIGGAVTWLISLFDPALYVGGLVSELTTFAAFTALMVFGPAMAGVTVGRVLIDRQNAKLPQHHHGLAAHEEEERADTDVFAAVSAGAVGSEASDSGAATAATSVGQPTVDWPTEEIPATTEELPADTGESPSDDTEESSSGDASR